MRMERVYNFNPGPATLPLEVLQEASRAMVEYGNTGMSVLEISHRSGEYSSIHNGCIALIKEVFHIPENYHVLFLGGGASTQFAMVPLNFLHEGKIADYVNTGSWAKKAIKEGGKVGTVNVAASTEEVKYRRIPKQNELKLTPDAAYAHITSNNTIFGTQWQSYPDVGSVPLVCDMSSDILSRPVDIGRFALIYAGAQKNLGPSGVTITILRDDMVERCPEHLLTMLNYRTHVEKNSLFNTPPVFAIYVVYLVVNWVKRCGGVEQIDEWNRQKGEMLYGVIDAHPDFYRSTVDADSRSLMNVTFRLPSEDLEEKFRSEALKEQFFNLKGHRSVGGIRVSMYNALPLEGIEKLAGFMDRFYRKNG
jgi:phosphoserine aminotransferase